MEMLLCGIGSQVTTKREDISISLHLLRRGFTTGVLYYKHALYMCTYHEDTTNTIIFTYPLQLSHSIISASSYSGELRTSTSELSCLDMDIVIYLR